MQLSTFTPNGQHECFNLKMKVVLVSRSSQGGVKTEDSIDHVDRDRSWIVNIF